MIRSLAIAAASCAAASGALVACGDGTDRKPTTPATSASRKAKLIAEAKPITPKGDILRAPGRRPPNLPATLGYHEGGDGGVPCGLEMSDHITFTQFPSEFDYETEGDLGIMKLGEDLCTQLPPASYYESPPTRRLLTVVDRGRLRVRRYLMTTPVEFPLNYLRRVDLGDHRIEVTLGAATWKRAITVTRAPSPIVRMVFLAQGGSPPSARVAVYGAGFRPNATAPLAIYSYHRESSLDPDPLHFLRLVQVPTDDIGSFEYRFTTRTAGCYVIPALARARRGNYVGEDKFCTQGGPVTELQPYDDVHEVSAAGLAPLAGPVLLRRYCASDGWPKNRSSEVITTFGATCPEANTVAQHGVWGIHGFRPPRGSRWSCHGNGATAVECRLGRKRISFASARGAANETAHTSPTDDALVTIGSGRFTFPLPYGWSVTEIDHRSSDGSLYRTRLRSKSDDAEVWIDWTPREPPTLPKHGVHWTKTAYAGGLVGPDGTRSAVTVPQLAMCRVRWCLDYQIKVGGGGLAVLGSGPSESSLDGGRYQAEAVFKGLTSTSP